jgi:hypothetical protein
MLIVEASMLMVEDKLCIGDEIAKIQNYLDYIRELKVSV